MAGVSLLQLPLAEVSSSLMAPQCRMRWNAIHHDLHLSVLAGVGGVLAVVLAAAHPTAHGVLHLRPRRGRGGGCRRDRS